MLSFLSSLLQSHVEVQVNRGIKGLGTIAVVGVMLLTAYIAAVLALALFLAERMSPWAAAAFIALGFALMAGLILLFVSLKNDADKRAEEAAARARQDTQAQMLSALTGGEGGGKQAMVIAAIAGLILSSLLGKGGDEDDDA